MFAAKTGKDLYIYMLSNRKLISNVQSTIEVEVLKWLPSDKKFEVTTKRQYLPFFIQMPEDERNLEDEFYERLRDKDTKVEDRVFYKFKDRTEKEADIEDQKLEFWNKIASSFRQSSEVNSSRLIFTAGSRSSWVFDLHMVGGNLRLYSRADFNAKRAIGLQKRPFCRSIDFIDDNFINLLTLTEEAKWKKPDVINATNA